MAHSTSEMGCLSIKRVSSRGRTGPLSTAIAGPARRHFHFGFKSSSDESPRLGQDEGKRVGDGSRAGLKNDFAQFHMEPKVQPQNLNQKKDAVAATNKIHPAATATFGIPLGYA
jgi:hypothetical protein